MLGHPLAATIGDSARCMQNLEKVLFTGPKTSDTVTFILRLGLTLNANRFCSVTACLTAAGMYARIKIAEKNNSLFCLTALPKRYEKHGRYDLEWACARVKQTTGTLVCLDRLRKCLDPFAFNTREHSASKKSVL